MTRKPISIEHFIRGGIMPDDHCHVITNDGTCSRCRKPVPEDDVPLTLWRETAPDAEGGHLKAQSNGRMWIYCEACLGLGRTPDEEDA